MKKFSLARVLSVASACIFLLTNAAYGDVAISIDLDTTADGIQSRRNVIAGETFDVAVVMELTGTSGIAAFSFGIDFDQAEIEVVGATAGTRPSGFGNVNAIQVDNLNGVVRPLDALSLTALEGPLTSVVGLLSVEVLAPVDDASFDLQPSLQVDGVDGFLDGDFSPVDPGTAEGDGGLFFHGGSITAVPEPGALSALLFASIGLSTSRRKR